MQKELKYSQPNSLSLFSIQCNFTEITRLIKSRSKILKCCSVELGLAISQKSADKTPIILHLQNEVNQVFFRGSKDPESVFSWNCNMLYYCWIFLNFLESHRFFMINTSFLLAWHETSYECHLTSCVTWAIIGKPLNAQEKLMFTGMKRTSIIVKPMSLSLNELLQKLLKGNCMFFQQWLKGKYWSAWMM